MYNNDSIDHRFVFIRGVQMRFVCENCGFEMDYEEDENEIIECEECGNSMFSDEEEEM